jgi:hypothetical protein
MSGADEIFELANDLGAAPAKVASALYDTFKEQGEEFAKDWRKNAEANFHSHAKKYPSSITSETRVGMGITVETGPEDSAANQGFLGRILEFGGERSPAYLDGLRALGPADARLMRVAGKILDGVLP